MHQLTGTRFGVIEFADDDLIRFEAGLIGFPHLHRFILIATKDDSPFRWLQAIDQPSLAFLVADPTHYVLDYAPEISDAQAKSLGLTTETAMMVVTTACIPPGKPEDMTLNLAGPLVMNLEDRVGAQIVIEDADYPTKYRVFDERSSAAA